MISLPLIIEPDPDEPGCATVRVDAAVDGRGAAAIRIDLDSAELTIETSGAAWLPWTLDRSPRGHPFLDLRWPDASGRAVFDTGAGITVVDTSFVRAHPELSLTPERPRARTRPASR